MRLTIEDYMFSGSIGCFRSYFNNCLIRARLVEVEVLDPGELAGGGTMAGTVGRGWDGPPRLGDWLSSGLGD